MRNSHRVQRYSVGPIESFEVGFQIPSASASRRVGKLMSPASRRRASEKWARDKRGRELDAQFAAYMQLSLRPIIDTRGSSDLEGLAAFHNAGSHDLYRKGEQAGVVQAICSVHDVFACDICRIY